MQLAEVSLSLSTALGVRRPLAFQNTERSRGIPRVKAAQGGCLLPRAKWTVNVTRPTADAT